MPKVLGLDFGGRHIGLAISDDDGRYAFGRGSITHIDTAGTLQQLKVFCQAEGVTTIVIGLPLDQHGQIGVGAQAVQAFGTELSAKLQLPVAYEDERFSTAAAFRLGHEAGKKVKKTKEQIHEQSAQVILQTYLDRRHVT